MSFSVYIVISIIGIFVCHVLATNAYYGPIKWRKYCFYGWLVVSLLLGSDHYGLAFENDPMAWNLLIQDNHFVITEEFSDMAFIFMLVTAATCPPSGLINGTVHLIVTCLKKAKLKLLKK